MNLITIDPGSKGSICVASCDKNFNIKKMKTFELSSDHKKTCQTIIKTIKRYRHKEIYVEKVHSMPSDGVVSAFTFGVNLGVIIGCLEAIKERYDFLHASVWKKGIKKIINIEDSELKNLNRNQKKKLYNSKIDGYLNKKKIYKLPNENSADSCGMVVFICEKKKEKNKKNNKGDYHATI